jgi:hypothetical protein
VNPCVKSLLERDKQLILRADSLVNMARQLPPPAYRLELDKLRREELQIFDAVKTCDFGDNLEAYNYWHRGRLKFPGTISRELQRLEQESKGE